MDVETTTLSPPEVAVDLLGLGICAGRAAGISALLDEHLDGRIAALLETGEASTVSGRSATIDGGARIAAGRVVAAGLGPVDEVDADSVRTAAARVGARALETGAATIAWVCDGTLPVPVSEQVRAAVDGVILGTYDPGRWKRNRPEPRLARLVLCGDLGDHAADLDRLCIAARWANECRTLVNAGGNEVTPERFAADARSIAERFPSVSCEVMGPEELRGAGMGALLAVAQGSALPPRLITLSYSPPGARAELTLGLVGKAITFDAGGLNLKPTAKLALEKSDMAGGAAVLCAAGAIAEAGIPLRVVAVLASCENMPSGTAYRPGDIVTAVDGTTIEVLDTDAEGRLALADALVHARSRGATHLVDLATLTGTSAEAMGDLYGCLFANDDRWSAQIEEAGRVTGDHLWPWPIHRSYRRLLRSTFADIRNFSEVRQAVPIYSAMFLRTFVGDEPWAHIDACGPSNLERSREDYLTCEGGTGFGVRLLTELAGRLARGSSASV
jgi:leucyl aminopeptidase